MLATRSILLAPALLLASIFPPPLLAQRPPGGQPAAFSDQQRALEQRQAMARSSLFAGLAWRAAGAAAGGVADGRVVDIEGVPGRPFSFYVAFETGGLWRSDDGGASFEPLWEERPTAAIGDIAVDPSNPARLWVGTGGDGVAEGVPAGMGIYRSDDGGKTFRYSGLGGSDRIARVAVDPRDGNVVYAAALGKLFSPGGMRGLYRSRDGGGRWELVLDPVAPGPAGAVDVAIDPRDPRILYAATWQQSRRPFDLIAAGPGSGIHKSEDGGDTWKRLEGGLPRGAGIGRIGLALAASRPEVLYAAVDVRDPLPPAEADLGGTALSPQRLRRMSPEEFLAQDPEAVAEFLREHGFDKSLDARRLIGEVERRAVTPAQLVAQLQEADPRLFAADIRGLEIYRSADGGASWQRSHAKPLREAVGGEGYAFGEIRVAPDDADRVFCLGRPLLVSGDGGKTFRGAAGEDFGDHRALFADPASPRRILVGSGGRVAVSHDGGTTFVALPPVLPEPAEEPVAHLPGAPYALLGQPAPRFFPRPPLVVSAHDPAIVYLGGDRLYRSADRGVTFAPLGPDLGPPAERGNLPNGLLTAVAESPREPGLLWVGTDHGEVRLSENGGASWADVAGSLPAGRRVSALEASRFEKARAYLGLEGSREDDLAAYVYRSEDYGRSWIPIGEGLPAEPLLALREDPVQREVLYAGTDRGVYVSLDRGRSWQALAAGLPTGPAARLWLDPREREIAVEIAGRGIYRLDALPIREAPRLLAEAQREAEIFPVATLEAERQWYARRDPWRRDLRREPRLAIPFFSAREGKATLELLDTGGRPLRRLELAVGRGVSTFRWDLLLDERLALTAEEALASRSAREQAALEKERAKARKKEKKDKKRGKAGDAEELKPPPLEKGALAKTPWAEALRLGRPLYVTPGVYTLSLTVGGANAKTLLRVEKPALRPEERFPLPRPFPGAVP